GPSPKSCCSSVVEHSLGKGEVDSSILSSSTSLWSVYRGGGNFFQPLGCGRRSHKRPAPPSLLHDLRAPPPPGFDPHRRSSCLRSFCPLAGPTKASAPSRMFPSAAKSRRNSPRNSVSRSNRSI